MTLTFGVENLDLHQKKCIPCQGGIPPLTALEIEPYIRQIHDDWKLIADHHIERVFSFNDFKSALEFVNQAGGICEEEDHHADFELSWGRVKIMIWTHKIDGLNEADFILAAKIDNI
tara:strand:- start:344 stop:694 length:351 start_codon:yes stop_codon:yes gene_type:complete